MAKTRLKNLVRFYSVLDELENGSVAAGLQTIVTAIWIDVFPRTGTLPASALRKLAKAGD